MTFIDIMGGGSEGVVASLPLGGGERPDSAQSLLRHYTSGKEEGHALLLGRV